MINSSKLPKQIVEDIKDFSGLADINAMTVTEAFDAYLKQNGIIGYTCQIIRTLDAIRASEV